MPRKSKFKFIGQPDADGFRDMTTEQKVGEKPDGTAIMQDITYRGFGEGADAPILFFTYGAKILAKGKAGDNAANEEMALFYNQMMYGRDLDKRSENKVGGEADPRVPLNSNELVDLVTGKVYTKKDKTEVAGRTVSLAERVEYINETIGVFARRAQTCPRGYTFAADELVAAGSVTRDAKTGKVAVKTNGSKK